MDFSADSKYLLTCNMAGAVKLWLTDLGRCVVTYRGYSIPAWVVRFSPLNRTFVVVSEGGNVFFYNTDDVQFVSRHALNMSDMTAFAWESNGTAFIGYKNGDVILINVE